MRARSLGYIVGVSPPLCVRSIGNTVGASPPRVCPLIGRQSLLDPCMLPTPFCDIFSNKIGGLTTKILLFKLCSHLALA